MRCDSQAAIGHAKSYIDKSRTRLISIKHHFIREKIAEGVIVPKFLPSDQNVADILTKPLNKTLHENHTEALKTLYRGKDRNITNSNVAENLWIFAFYINCQYYSQNTNCEVFTLLARGKSFCVEKWSFC